MYIVKYQTLIHRLKRLSTMGFPCPDLRSTRPSLCLLMKEMNF